MYFIDNIISEDTIEDLRYDIANTPPVPASVSSGTTNLNYRSTSLIPAIKPSDYPDVCNSLINMACNADPFVNRHNLEVVEFNLLVYNKGDHFVKHIDTIKVGRRRFYSTTTVLYKSTDLEGGDFLIWDDDNKAKKIDLEVGQTIMFSSTRPHQVTPIERGRREVLVAWIHRKDAQ